MPLRFDLGPFEKLYIGTAVLTNSHERACVAIEGNLPILRGKDVLQPELANNSLEKLYCCLQKIYLEQAFALKEEPSLYSRLKELDALFVGGEQYKALKALKTMIRPTAFVSDRSEPEGYVRRAMPGPRQ
jgi:flagellar biosynthesis repressor protein FlbT